MDDKPFDTSIAVGSPDRPTLVGSTREALDWLTTKWPEDRGPRADDAVDACLKVLDGHRSTIDAQTAFAEAAREAGILVDGGGEPLNS